MHEERKPGKADTREVEGNHHSARRSEEQALREKRRERAGPALEILRDLAMHIERRPTEAELLERLAREPAFTFLDQDELLRSARRANNEGRGLDSRVLKPARERQKRVREALELDKDFDHAATEDALSNPIFFGGPGLPKRRTLKVGGTRIRRNPPKP